MVWTARGVTPVLPEAADGVDPAAPTSIFLPAGAAGPAFLVFDNFRVVLKYNHAFSYALGVCLLSDRLAGKPPLGAPWPRSIPSLKRIERLSMQQGLSRLGFDVGGIDGVIGMKTRAAVRAFQKAHDLPADGYATPDLVARIAAEAKAASGE
jgi:membrane-bound lytic murein transglycosylase B